MKVYLAIGYYSDGSGWDVLGVRRTTEGAHAVLGKAWVENVLPGCNPRVMEFDLDEEDMDG